MRSSQVSVSHMGLTSKRGCARGGRPDLSSVLSHVVPPGRNVRLHYSREQRLELSDQDGLLACKVLRALLKARHAAVTPRQPPAAFPLTEDAFQAVALKLGYAIGD